MSSYLYIRCFVRNQRTYSWNAVSKHFCFEFILPSRTSCCNKQGVSVPFHFYIARTYISPSYLSLVSIPVVSLHILLLSHSHYIHSSFYPYTFLYPPIFLRGYPFRADFLPLPSALPTNPPLTYHATHKGQRARHERDAPPYRNNLVTTSHLV